MCRVKGTVNFTGAPPGPGGERAGPYLHGIRMVGTKKEANATSGRFVKTCGNRYGKAAGKPGNGRDGLLAFHRFPAEHLSTSGRGSRGPPDPEDRPFDGLSPHDVGEWRKLPAQNGLPEVIRGGVSDDRIRRESAAA